MKLFVGSSGYSYKEWRGTFYPEELSEKRMLHYYGERFRTVEINNTFHRMPTVQLLEGWAGEVPSDFKFVLKAPQQITHLQRLRDVDESMSYLMDVTGVLRERLGALLFQLPPNLKKDLPLLRDFLALIPPGRQVAVEFRHQSWFDPEVFALLRRNNAAFCVADADNDLEVPFIASADWGYLRLRRLDYTVSELKRWAKLVRGEPWRDVYVFFKHEEGAKGPMLAQRFLELAG